jgi:hypothetical protein
MVERNESEKKRMGQDSNLRWTHAHSGFQDRRLRPLGHPSEGLFLPCFPDGVKAFELWKHKEPYHREGRIPPPLPRLVEESDVLSVKKLLNEFLNFKREMIESGTLAERSLADYVATGELMAEHLGKSCPVANLTLGDLSPARLLTLRERTNRGRS